MSVAEWSVRNRVAANLMMMVVLVAGFLAATTRLKLDLFPDVSTNYITVSVLDRETSIPSEIERGVALPLEEELNNVKGVVAMRTVCEEYLCTIYLEIDAEIENLEPVLNEVRQAVDKAKPKLPVSAEAPVVETFDIPFPLVTFAVTFPPGFEVMRLRTELKQLESDLRMLPGVSAVLVDGLDRREVWIEIDPDLLLKMGLSYGRVVEAVRQSNRNVAVGRLETADGLRQIRIVGEAVRASDLADVAVEVEAGGGTVRLGDIAILRDRTERPRRLGRANSRSAVTMTIVKKKGADAIETAESCKRVFREAAAKFPEGVETQVLSETTKFIKTRINTVTQNGLQALILVTMLLVLFLDWRLAVLVGVGIPVSFAGSFLVLYLTGNTINLLSLFGMIMALGMVVDDAIVMAENCYRLIEEGKTPVEAAIQGAGEVFWPVVGSVSTTVAAFLPLIWGEGIIGKFLAIVPVVVISALTFSILQAFLVLPSHVSDFVRLGMTVEEVAKWPVAGLWERMKKEVAMTYQEMRLAVDRGMRVVMRLYLDVLVIFLRWRYLSIVAFLGALLGVVGLVASGAVPFKLFSTDFADLLIVKLQLPHDYSLRQTEAVVERLERRLAERLPAEDVLGVITRVGAKLEPSDQFLEYGENLAMMTVDLDEENPRARRPSVVAREIQRVLGEFPEFVQASAKPKEGGPPVGKAVNVELMGMEVGELLGLAAELERRMAAEAGFLNIGNDYPAGKTEYAVRVDEGLAQRAGMGLEEIGLGMQAVFRGVEAARLRWGNEEVILRVKAPEWYMQDVQRFQTLQLPNREGAGVALDQVSTVELRSSSPRIKRRNGRRVVTVSADVDGRVLTPREANEKVRQWLGEMLPRYGGVRVELSGENRDTERSLAAMKFAAVVALLLIYALLAMITNSFLQPVVIMSVIPFGLIGVLLGLLVVGKPLGLMSLMGTIALAGIVVNNSVVFVDFLNRLRHEATRDADWNPRHQPFWVGRVTRWRSILETARVRFRPVLLTTATTIAGLLSLAFTTRGQEQFLAPMAQAIVFGLGFAASITMLLIPCLYSVLDDLHGCVRRKVGWGVRGLGGGEGVVGEGGGVEEGGAGFAGGEALAERRGRE